MDQSRRLHLQAEQEVQAKLREQYYAFEDAIEAHKLNAIKIKLKEGSGTAQALQEEFYRLTRVYDSDDKRIYKQLVHTLYPFDSNTAFLHEAVNLLEDGSFFSPEVLGNFVNGSLDLESRVIMAMVEQPKGQQFIEEVTESLVHALTQTSEENKRKKNGGEFFDDEDQVSLSGRELKALRTAITRSLLGNPELRYKLFSVLTSETAGTDHYLDEIFSRNDLEQLWIDLNDNEELIPKLSRRDTLFLHLKRIFDRNADSFPGELKSGLQKLHASHRSLIHAGEEQVSFPAFTQFKADDALIRLTRALPIPRQLREWAQPFVDEVNLSVSDPRIDNKAVTNEIIKLHMQLTQTISTLEGKLKTIFKREKTPPHVQKQYLYQCWGGEGSTKFSHLKKNLDAVIVATEDLLPESVDKLEAILNEYREHLLKVADRYYQSLSDITQDWSPGLIEEVRTLIIEALDETYELKQIEVLKERAQPIRERHQLEAALIDRLIEEELNHSLDSDPQEVVARVSVLVQERLSALITRDGEINPEIMKRLSDTDTTLTLDDLVQGQRTEDQSGGL